MKKLHALILLSLAPLFLCTACNDQPAKTATLVQAPAQPQQFTDIRWDELTAARSVAHVNNNGLIMMR